MACGDRPGTCDGCGQVYASGELVGAACNDFSVLRDWGGPAMVMVFLILACGSSSWRSRRPPLRSRTPSPC